MLDLYISWSELKAAASRGFSLYFVAFAQGTTPETYHYVVMGMEGSDRFYTARLDTGTEASDFEASYKSSATEVSSRDAVIASNAPPINSLGAQLVEVTSRLSQKASMTLVSHDFSKPTTWWQNATLVTNETLTPLIVGSSTYDSSHNPWLNVEDPGNFSDEFLNPGWAQGGYQNADFWYYAWVQPDGTYVRRSTYYPVVQVRPGGTGSWVTVTTTDATYGYTVDYNLGRIHFNSILAWQVGTTVRATYYYVTENAAGSGFEVGPPTGKKWHLTRTEVQMSSGTSWNDSVIFEGKAYGVVGQRAVYKTYGNMQSTATSQGMTMKGSTGLGSSFPASSDNGWTYGGTNSARQLTADLEIIPWVYARPFVLLSSMQARVKISLGAGNKFTTTDLVNVSYYVDEYDE